MVKVGCAGYVLSNMARVWRVKRTMCAKYFRCLVLLILVVSFSGCGYVGGQPIYPESWPPLAALDTGSACPDISGKYRAVSDEPGPLIYPPDHRFTEFFFFIPLRDEKPPPPRPPRGRRILPWVLSGTFQEKSPEDWNALTQYAAALEADSADFLPKDETGWVQVSTLPDSVIEIRAGLHEQTFIKLEVSQGGQPLLSNKSHLYQCHDGTLEIYGSFPPPSVENPYHSTSNAISWFSFYRAVDGSLVMMKNDSLAQVGNQSIPRFQ